MMVFTEVSESILYFMRSLMFANLLKKIKIEGFFMIK